MYKPVDKLQHSFLDFNQPLGLKMNPENRWIRLADSIPWDELEQKYADLFPSDTGNVAKPLRMALGSLIIQKKFQFSDRELVEQITENPYLQYFIGLPGYQEEPPFDPSTLVLFLSLIHIFVNATTMQSVDFLWLLQGKDDNRDMKMWIQRNGTKSRQQNESFRMASGIVRYTPKSGGEELKKIINAFLNR